MHTWPTDERARKILDELMWPAKGDTLNSFLKPHLRNTCIISAALRDYAEEQHPCPHCKASRDLLNRIYDWAVEHGYDIKKEGKG